ncbi:MAG: tetratricopeptide repeat protein [Planctomycetota bacterium]
MPQTLRLTLLLLALLAPPAAAQGPFGWFRSGGEETQAARGPDWWDDHKDEAVFEPGKGYSVPGVEGYFDSKGRPIGAPVDEVFEDFSGQEESNGLIPGLDPRKGYRRAKAAVGLGPNQQAAKAALAEGEALVQQKQFAKAEGPLETAADRWPKSDVAVRATFLLGECYFFQDRYNKARKAYEKVVAEQPNTRDLDTLVERMWAIAQYWEKHFFENETLTLQPNLTDRTRPTFDTLGYAIKAYESIRLNDPTGPRADDAIMATASIYFRRSRFHDADYHYTLLRREYPRSDHQFDAHILGLQAKLQKYMGPDYDGAALVEAKVLLKQIKTQFGGRLTAEEKERLRRAEADVQLAIEQRDLRMAEYYENIEHYGAARQVWAQIAREHSKSPIGERARQRYAELKDLPDMPPTRLASFVELFPENAERSRVAGVREVTSPGGTRLATPTTESGVRPQPATLQR